MKAWPRVDRPFIKTYRVFCVSFAQWQLHHPHTQKHKRPSSDRYMRLPAHALPKGTQAWAAHIAKKALKTHLERSSLYEENTLLMSKHGLKIQLSIILLFWWCLECIRCNSSANWGNTGLLFCWPKPQDLFTMWCLLVAIWVHPHTVYKLTGQVIGKLVPLQIHAIIH